MTGVEAVSNGVTAFREPAVDNARRTLSAIIGILVILLAGIAYLAVVYHIGATEPGVAVHQSVLSPVVARRVATRTVRFLSNGSLLLVIRPSANTRVPAFSPL